ncbi:hypothetical protein LTR62_007896 [Meristemomyces frigidus]|uniref:DUF7730 domain-containing protein n=1 Tax=Meristemomyces frigidus TaxID=1508187 RepID=A0AAN7TGV5_9PEZI|nr:hypothetical protein LTR62_007896 [Meristemomyces frigidus]
MKLLDASRRAGARTMDYNQSGCGLFHKLPTELRAMIWGALLSEFNKTPHFHIYDKVYDSCVVDPEPVEQCRLDRRREGSNTSILLVCRRMNDEILPLLYNATHFEIVLLPGRALPVDIKHVDMTSHRIKTVVVVEDNLRRRNSLGKLVQCPMLKRIRHATVILQTGRHVNTENYRQRLTDFLHAIDNGVNLNTLCIGLCPRIDRTAFKQTDMQWMLRALQPLNITAGERQGGKFTILPHEDHWSFCVWPSFDAKCLSTSMLQTILPTFTIKQWEEHTQVLSLPQCYFYGLHKLKSWRTPPAFTPVAPVVSKHPRLQKAVHRTGRVALYSTVTLLSPLILVGFVVAEMQYRRRKGQRVWDRG